MNKLITLLLLLSLGSCQQPTQKEAAAPNANPREFIPDQDPEMNPKNHPSHPFQVIITEADNLRLRAKPTLKGAILETLPINTALQYLEKTKTEEKITMKGLEHTAPWLKVKTSTGKQGWVYGSQGVENKHAPMIRFMTSENTSKAPIELVNGITAAKLEAITGLTGIATRSKSYAGFYQYRLVNGKKQLNGDLELIGRIYAESYKFWLSDTYSGNYKDGFPNGKIIEQQTGVEGSSQTTIEFKAGSFECHRIVQSWDAEGENGMDEDNQPEHCSFDVFD